MIVIDAKDLIIGRLATFVAKQALAGEQIRILNVEHIVITGDPKQTLEKYKQRRALGAPLIGPYFPRTPERIVKRAIKGMLPTEKLRGREALAKVRCYQGIPEEFASKINNEILPKNVHVDKTHAKYLTILRISKEL